MILYKCPRFAVLASTVFVWSVGAAQTAEQDRLTAPTKVSSTAYQSAFAGYISYQEPTLMPWQAANEVVREFGSMAAMNGQHSMHGVEKGVSTEGSQHDMGKMQHQALPPTAEKPLPAARKSSEAGHPPGHDMGKMNSTGNANKAAPHPNRLDIQDGKGMDDMKSMPGHDMGSTKKQAGPVPANRPSPSPDKPAAAGPKTMHDHSGMK